MRLHGVAAPATALLVCAPALLCARAALDEVAQPHVGPFPLVALLVFPLLAVTSRGKERTAWVGLGVSCIILAIVGGWIGVSAQAAAVECRDFKDIDTSTDASLAAPNPMRMPLWWSYWPMPTLEDRVRARVNASHFYADCLENVRKQVVRWPLEAQLARLGLMTVQECPNYEAMKTPELEVVERSERMFACAGVCERRAPLWTRYTHYVPACGPIRNNYLERSVARTGMVACFASLLGAMAVIVALYLRDRTLRK